MTIEQVKKMELARIKLEIDRTEDNLIYWMHEILKDSIAEVEDSWDSRINITEWQLTKITEKLIGNLISDIDDGMFGHLSRQAKKLKTLHKDFDYLNH